MNLLRDGVSNQENTLPSTGVTNLCPEKDSNFTNVLREDATSLLNDGITDLNEENNSTTGFQNSGSRGTSSNPVSLREAGTALVAAAARQLDALLQYRAAQPHHRIYLIPGVLNFYDEIERPHMYIR